MVVLPGIRGSKTKIDVPLAPSAFEEEALKLELLRFKREWS
jgi:hypothetical protein